MQAIQFKKLYRDGGDWYLDPYDFSPNLPIRLSGLNVPAVAPGYDGSTMHEYAVTSFYDNGQESIDSNTSFGPWTDELSPSHWIQLGWNSDAAGITYNVYKKEATAWGTNRRSSFKRRGLC